MDACHAYGCRGMGAMGQNAANVSCVQYSCTTMHQIPENPATSQLLINQQRWATHSHRLLQVTLLMWSLGCSSRVPDVRM